MLTRKCEEMLSNLFKKGDFNVRVTIVDSKVREMSNDAWIEVFRDAIGGGIVNNGNVYFDISCKTENSSTIFKCKGKKIIEACSDLLEGANSARIDLSPFPMPKDQNNHHTWIIVANVE